MIFFRIPRNIIYSKDFGENRVFILSYLLENKTSGNYSFLCIKNMCSIANKKISNSINGINYKYCSTLEKYKQLNIINSDINFNTTWAKSSFINQYQKIILNTQKLDYLNGYGIIYLYELQLIYDYISKNNENCLSQLLLLLSYIRVNINSNNACCWRHIKTISDDIGVSRQSINKCINILSNLNIIATSLGKTYKYYQEEKEIFIKLPAVFCNYYKYTKDDQKDLFYNPDNEIKKCVKYLADNIKNTY